MNISNKIFSHHANNFEKIINIWKSCIIIKLCTRPFYLSSVKENIELLPSKVCPFYSPLPQKLTWESTGLLSIWTLDSYTNKRWPDIHFDVKIPHQVLLEYKVFVKKEKSSKGKACVYCHTRVFCHWRNKLHEYFIHTRTISERIYSEREKKQKAKKGKRKGLARHVGTPGMMRPEFKASLGYRLKKTKTKPNQTIQLFPSIICLSRGNTCLFCTLK